MNYAEWERGVPEILRADPLWQMKVYQVGLFVSDLGWSDVTKLMQDARTLGLAGRLYEALGSISANLTAAYAYSTREERAHYYECSLSAARASRDWYFKGRHVLGETVVQHRLELLTEIIRILANLIPPSREPGIREEQGAYQTDSVPVSDDRLNALLQNCPMP